ncbi:MFS transporter [Litorisediminicola beolgyonensis]|uniref:MFS transporter n=1 Tax=Litorisediminicola beolgyonensis TaxID=1173614 RepID=A0ABW3ZK81_9RHOB
MRLAVTLAIAVTGNVGMWSVIAVLPEVAQEFGASRSLASLPYTLTMLGFALGNLVIGGWVDRFGISRVLALSGATLSLAYWGAAQAGSIWALAAVQFVIGFATSASFGPLVADLSLWFLRRRGIAVAIAASGNYLAGAIWPVALGYLNPESSWRWDYATLGVATLLVVVPLSTLLRARVPDEALAAAETARAARARSTGFTPRQLMWLLGIAGIGCCVAMSMPQVHIVALCVDLGYGPVAGAEMLSVMLLGGVVSRILSGMIADVLGGLRTLLLGSVLQMLALFLYLPAQGLTSLYLVSLVFGLAQGGIIPSYAVIVREYLPAREAGRRVGFVIMMTILGMALGGWMSGWIYDVSGSYALAFWNGIAFNALNIAVMLTILTRSRRAGGPLPA